MSDEMFDQPPAPGWRDRLHSLLTPVDLPPLQVDLATYRRLLAMQNRLIIEDPSLADEPGGCFEHIIYAAICGGLRENEKDSGVKFNENTGRIMREETT